MSARSFPTGTPVLVVRISKTGSAADRGEESTASSCDCGAAPTASAALKEPCARPWWGAVRGLLIEANVFEVRFFLRVLCSDAQLQSLQNAHFVTSLPVPHNRIRALQAQQVNLAGAEALGSAPIFEFPKGRKRYGKEAY
jgi:hypothetical protein